MIYLIDRYFNICMIDLLIFHITFDLMLLHLLVDFFLLLLYVLLYDLYLKCLDWMLIIRLWKLSGNNSLKMFSRVARKQLFKMSNHFFNFLLNVPCANLK